jgi:hypothetical protein
MSQGGFQRVYPVGDGFLRVPGRLLVESYTSPFPANLSQIINVVPNLSTYASEVQTATMSGSPTGGTFSLAFLSYATSALAYNCTAAQVQTAFQGLPGIGPGNVTCAGGPFPATPITVTFAGAMANLAQPLITVPSSLVALTGGASPAVTIARTIAGNGLYDPVGVWTELGATKTGIHLDRNNTETLIDVDQILTSLLAIPDNWEMTLTTAFAETTFENISLAWEGQEAIILDTTQTPNERQLPMGAPLDYIQRRVALLAYKTIGPSAGRIRAFVFRNCTRSPVASRMTFDKTGPQQTIPFVFRAFADQNIGDPLDRFGRWIEQMPN